MITPGQLYVAVITVLFLAAIGVSIPVLKRIYRDGLERHRERRAGERERYTEDEEYGPDAGDTLEEDTPSYSTCRQCGAENDPEFTYCRRCATPL